MTHPEHSMDLTSFRCSGRTPRLNRFPALILQAHKVCTTDQSLLLLTDMLKAGGSPVM